MSQSSRLQLLFLLTFVQIVVGSQMYITPSPTSQCPNGVESCLTLSLLATNTSIFLDSNVTQLVFLAGNHTIGKDLIISHVQFLTLHSNSSFSVSVTCSEGAHINFTNITNLQISGLEFIGCSSSVEFVEQFSLKFSKFHEGSNGSALQLTQTNANISQSSFTCNTMGTLQSLMGFLKYFYWSIPQTTLDQSHSARIGGAIVVTSSNLHVSNSHFDSNKAEVGGAIFSQMGSNVTITDSTFVNNSATGCKDLRCHGGAMFIDRACNVDTENNTFVNNTSEVGGGVITLFQGILFDKQNIFIGNNASTWGGVISAYDRSSITIQSSMYRSIATKVFRLSYHSVTKGGVIFMKGQCNITVYNSSFENSKAFLGGALHISSSSSITVYNSYFNGSVAVGDGGVMYASYSSNIYVYDSSFDNSEAGIFGGVIYAFSSCGITVHNSYFGNNGVIKFSGGVIFASSAGSITVYNSTFENNKAGSHGGVLCVYVSSSITVHYSSFDGNRAGDDGGVMSGSFASRIQVYESSFYNNKADRNGGVMDASSDSNVTVYNSSFDNNKVRFAGGIVYASSSSIWVHGSSFDHSAAGREGGVIYTYFSNITVRNSSFENSDAGSNGGVIYSSSSSNITVYNSFFDNSVAGSDGGVMYAHYTNSVAVYDSQFINNKAGRDSGVMFADTSNFNVYNSFFDNSEAYRYGGVIYTSSSNISVYSSSFDNNHADSGGVMYAESSSIITVYNSSFDNSIANNTGGVVYETSGISSCFIPPSIQSLHSVSTKVMFKNNCTFGSNSASEGGVAYVYLASLIDSGSVYHNNVAHLNGGVATLNESVAKVSASTFVNNSAGNSGGVLFTPTHIHQTQITLENSKFDNNRAIKGGALAILANEILAVTKSSFTHNHAHRGGVLYLLTGNMVTLSYCEFFHNSAQRDGGVIYSDNKNKLIMNSNKINFNIADNNGGVLCSLAQTYVNIDGEECTFVRNQAQSGGAIYSTESNVDVHSRSLLLVSNTAEETGGAIHLSKSSVTFFCDSSRAKETAVELGAASNDITLVGNEAGQGGAIYSSESKVLIDILCSQVHISANSARRNGGGLYLTMSELTVRGYSSAITRNGAVNSGGGIHAENSCVTIEGAVHFMNNEAGNGGGISLERYTKFQGISQGNHHSSMDFISNVAHYYGGAVYVNDETNQDLCMAINAQNATLTNECFLSMSVFMKFWNNSAGISGSNLFGGYLDRCKVLNIRPHEHEANRPLGVDIFLSSSNISDLQLDTISSHPVQLCFCRDRQPDCDYQPEFYQVNSGTTFSVEIIAYNQVHEAVNANIHSSLSSSAGGLDEGQDIQEINSGCTELRFQIFSPKNLHELTLSIETSCSVAGVSQKNLTIEITCTCPIGFEPLSNTLNLCDCVCHQVLQPYVETQCNATSQTIIRNDNFWIDYINQSGYIIYPNCPYDYCQPPEEHVHVNLGIPEGADAQCASNRSGTLCGSCRPGFSVSLGSSSCLRCPQYWPGLLVVVVTVFILSGIGLVALILVLNLTVAIGTINAVIFYANIMAANKSALFRTSELTFASVFISWLNFDLGIDTCFFDGMDTYVKTWLQLAFPAYIIVLVIVVIQLSYRFVGFGRLIGKKDPAATLATLVLLSYAKLLQTIITTFSSATLHYPDNSNKTVWLPDASVGYFSFKHAVLFFATIVILLFSLVYTFLLLTWQWFLSCPRKRSSWVKLSSFLEMYHVPYNQEHRYWSGLLLLVRVAVYLVSACNPSNDPRIALLSTSFIISCLLSYMTIFGVKMYKNRFTNTLEILTYFNISAVSVFTWYSFDSDNVSRLAIANVSVGATFIQLILIIFYHAYNHVNRKLLLRIQETVCYVKIKEKLRKQKGSDHQQPLADDDIHHFHALLDTIDRPVDTSDYNVPQVKQKPVEPTTTVVELPKPHLASRPHLEEVQVELHHQPNEEDNKTAREKILTSPMTDETKESFDDCSAEEIPELTMHPTASGKRRTILTKTCFLKNTSNSQEELNAPDD